MVFFVGCHFLFTSNIDVWVRYGASQVATLRRQKHLCIFATAGVMACRQIVRRRLLFAANFLLVSCTLSMDASSDAVAVLSFLTFLLGPLLSIMFPPCIFNTCFLDKRDTFSKLGRVPERTWKWQQLRENYMEFVGNPWLQTKRPLPCHWRTILETNIFRLFYSP